MLATAKVGILNRAMLCTPLVGKDESCGKKDFPTNFLPFLFSYFSSSHHQPLVFCNYQRSIHTWWEKGPCVLLLLLIKPTWLIYLLCCFVVCELLSFNKKLNCFETNFKNKEEIAKSSYTACLCLWMKRLPSMQWYVFAFWNLGNRLLITANPYHTRTSLHSIRGARLSIV